MHPDQNIKKKRGRREGRYCRQRLEIKYFPFPLTRTGSSHTPDELIHVEARFSYIAPQRLRFPFCMSDCLI